ncbi:FAD-dependent thymidylate synthase [Candidatus Nitronereus thalassa]|uniref:FAD-dependent thymidylate synthase n=1 Tax=Candidatus Nitronereus thalassa TaxID=3020898 RepID=A0ABU3KAN4_9BACT|nr:FAD-dependent thymidylate synthase [Candidatus Nitronereus thalassa]MDT7043535.1 FAD-dependent thymidylate synthase [Candidatus Nitronereus thalassa]
MSDKEKATRRIVVLAPMPPEKSAYALARYSRSPDSIEESLQWVHGHSSEKFWEQFYFAYGHGSIADLGHVTISLENISELAAIRVEDEPLWDGQAKSSRYQNFAVSGCYMPSNIEGTETEALYRGVLGSLFNLYQTFHNPLQQFLREQSPKPDAMKQSDYDRTIAARTFDVTRYLLPLAAKTNVGQVVSIRTLEKQITRLLSAQLPELKAIGEELKDACAKRPSDVWPTLCGSDGSGLEPLAPTLARHANANAYQAEVYRDLQRYAKKVLRKAGLDTPTAWAHRNDPVDLIEPHPLQDELVATLLYRASHAPYRSILEVVQGMSIEEKEETIQVAYRHRGPYDELIKEFRCGYPLIFDVLMDIGGWRDMHRHRRCQQVQQNFTTMHGYDMPKPLVEAGLDRDYQLAMDAVKQDLERMRGLDQESAIYAIPFGFKVRCLFKMDYAEAEYISQLRSGVKGHWSYRTIAWLMKKKMTEQYPYLGELIQATPPDVEDTLTR